MEASMALQNMGLLAKGSFDEEEHKKLLQQAQHLWSLLDEMADSDPGAYQRFIQRQTADYKEMMAPPQQYMCVKTHFQSGEAVYINIMSWPRIPPPKSQNDSIPLYAAPVTHGQAGEKEVSVVTNPEVLKECRKDMSERTAFVHLVLDYLEHLCEQRLVRHFEMLPADTCFKGDLKATQKVFLQSLRKSANKRDSHGKVGDIQEREGSAFMPLSDLTVSDDGSRSNPMVMPPDLLTSAGMMKRGEKALIEEMDLADELKTPEYELHISPTASTVVLTIYLPLVTAVSQCQLDISQDDVELLVPEKYQLSVTLPVAVDDTNTHARFSKKLSTLTLTMPAADRKRTS